MLQFGDDDRGRGGSSGGRGRGRGGSRRTADEPLDSDRYDGGEAAQEAHDEYGFTCRQAALRAVERFRRSQLRPSDKLFVVFCLYFADRRSKYVGVILGSQLRPEYESPEAQLSSVELSHEEITDLRGVLDELRVSASATHGVEAAQASAETLESFWARCLRFLEALEAVRAAELESSKAGRIGFGSSIGTSQAAAVAKEEVEDRVLDLLSRTENLAATVAELKGLAASPDPGVDCDFFNAAALMGDVLVARRLLQRFEEENRLAEDPPPPPTSRGQATDGEPTEEDCTDLMNALGERLEGDQQHLFMDELTTYGKDHAPAWANRAAGPTARKPDRFAKVLAGYRWNRYNKAHYNSATNPPPKTVLGYEFTLLYPDLEVERHPSFTLLPTDKGWEDEYCIIVFKAGPPYLDVAYRIVNRQWDKRKGGVKALFEPSGRFKLYFRFTSTSYRR